MTIEINIDQANQELQGKTLSKSLSGRLPKPKTQSSPPTSALMSQPSYI
nr:hypothetical protein [Psychrobacter sp. PraFG1]UNK06345.1 hypothetical protein MN210_07360 [Psychrobacter sp. PraFG1]